MFFYIGFILLIVACSQNNNTTSQNASKSSNDSIEVFNDFLIKFKADSIFQKSRIIFPLLNVTYNPYDGTSEISFVKKNQYIYNNFYWDSSYAKRERDAITQKIKVLEDTAWIYFLGVDNGINGQLVFVCNNGKWFYFKSIDHSD